MIDADAILEKYPLPKDFDRAGGYLEYSRVKRKLRRDHGYLEPREYEAWVDAVTGILGI